uniref:Bag of marbles n=1 Tax=Drosophila prostipennis TaxID=94111 RepID=A1YJZ4_9MUSC|nr:bag of marbles [Drosophila prostipennis]
MFNARALGVGLSALDDLQLARNLMERQEELSSMLETNESAPLGSEDSENDEICRASSSSGVLSEIQNNFRGLRLDHSAPSFEFHGFNCLQQLYKRSRHAGCGGSSAKKSRSGCPALFFVSGPKQEQLQKENMWNQRRREEVNNFAQPITIEKLRSINLHGDCLEHNAVVRVLNLFRSLHDHLTADLGFSRQNSMPSDYLFAMPVKNSMPKSLNVRYQLQVLCTKVERFLTQQRRILETNHHFDFEKYSECDKLLKGSSSYLQSFNQFLTIEMRHRNGNFVNNSAKSLLLAAAELEASKARSLTDEEIYIGQQYKLENAVNCAIEQDEFLTALLAHPENYFPPNVMAICGPPRCEQDGQGLPDWMEEYELEDEAPSSPPRRYDRVFLRPRS